MFLAKTVFSLSVLLANLPWSDGAPKLAEFIKLDTTKDSVIEIGKFAAKKINDSKLLKCLSASRRVVSGYEYDMSIKKCRPSEQSSQICDVKVFDQPWASTRALEDWKCKSQKPMECQCQCFYRKYNTTQLPCMYEDVCNT